MMKAEELRKGNVFTRLGKEVIVYGHNMPFVYIEGRRGSVNIHHLEPIPITPSILEEWGFKKEFAGTDQESYFLWVSDDMSLNTWHAADYTIWCGNHNTQCKYLHQLQNLYFSLTQTELTHDTKRK